MPQRVESMQEELQSMAMTLQDFRKLRSNAKACQQQLAQLTMHGQPQHGDHIATVKQLQSTLQQLNAFIAQRKPEVEAVAARMKLLMDTVMP